MSHDHAHALSPRSLGTAFLTGILLNLGFLVVEFTVGLRSHALSLVADAVHNLADVLSLAMAWLAFRLASQPSSVRRTYGFQRAGVLAAMANGGFLLLVTGGIVWEALGRFRHPEPIPGSTMMVVAGLGIVVNLGSALLLHRGGEEDLNVRGAFLHLVADAAVSLGVVAAGAGLYWTGWTWLDPAISLLVSAMVLVTAWPLFRSALDLAMDAVPGHVDLASIKAFLLSAPGVRGLHHLHVWGLSTSSTALTVHLVVAPGADALHLGPTLAHEIEHRFRIDHATLQVEAEASPCPCPLAARPLAQDFA